MRRTNIIGERIRLLRRERGWTQVDLTRILQTAGYRVTRDIIARWETRKISVPDTGVVGLATVLRVSILDLFPMNCHGARPINRQR
jgi:transcriptional regulator with XRE-family HTH domain